MVGFVFFALGLAGVVAGAYLLVLGASRLASMLGVPSMVIGMTVVGFGTSMPELAVSAIASWDGHPDTAFGNVVGSNIANVALILGLSAVVIPLVPDRTLLRREGPVLIGVSVVVVLLGMTGTFDPWMGALLLAGLAGFVVAAIWWSREEPEVVVDQVEHFREQSGLAQEKPAWLSALYAAGGIALLAAGGWALVSGAVDIAEEMGIQEFALATTVVAVGTSLPELVTSLTAALRREADIAIGNVVGSNIFNLLAVLGLAAVINPVPVTDEMRWLDLPWMAGLTAIGVLFTRQGYALGRSEGTALLFAWLVYVVWLVLR